MPLFNPHLESVTRARLPDEKRFDLGRDPQVERHAVWLFVRQCNLHTFL
jgi:hypothetical protein